MTSPYNGKFLSYKGFGLIGKSNIGWSGCRFGICVGGRTKEDVKKMIDLKIESEEKWFNWFRTEFGNFS